MFIRILIPAIVCVIGGAAAPLPIEQERQMQQHIERLVAEAREHEQIAKRLHVEAEQIKARLAGRPDRLEIPQQDRVQAKGRVMELREMAEQAKKAGDTEKARRLWAESKDIEVALQKGQAERELNEMHGRLRELDEAAAEAERQGQHDRAAQLRKKAEDTEQAIHAQVRKQQAVRIKQEAAHLRQRAALAKSEGRHDEARAIMNEAENLERHAFELAGPSREPKKPQDDKQMLLERIERLEVRVERLSKALAQLQQSGR
ncbi:MAG TPA: hypothetical protein ENN81_03115 [Phycisphaerales bacterium]|nr:hypothetical protein [Phycisphaerales bacterium]